ncbi:MAG: amidohydrolase family protein [Phycisphaerae bacterium]|nr:amidohydrolase family protein [Phycisphaerae bacterium]
MNRRYKHFDNRRTIYIAAISILITVLSVPTVMAEESSIVAVKAGTIIPITSPPIQGGIVIIRDGKIEAVGKNLKIPDGAEVIDATDKVVIPGLIDAFTTLAGSSRDDEESVTPDIRAKDAFDFYGKYRRLLAGGVTTVYVSPGQRRLISGVGAVVKLAGDSIDERCLKDTSALRITLGELPKSPPSIFKPPLPPDPCHPLLPVEKQLPTTRMAEMAVLRKVFTDAKWATKQKSPEMDSKMQALMPVLKRKIPVRINCHTAQDIRNAIRFAETFKLKLIIEGATEAYEVIDEIKSSKSPVVVTGVFEPGRQQLKDYTTDIALGRVNPENPGLLAKAGVKFAITSPTDGTIPDLQFIAGYAVSRGLSPEEALKAITITPAEILGLADRIGSIEKGKDADLVILTGDPLDVRSIVDRTLIDGKVVYARPEVEPKKEETEQASITAIRAGKILTASRGQINDGLILIEGDKIAYVGGPKEIPENATVIDAAKSVVMPGLVDIHSHLGLHAESEPVKVNPSAPTSGPDSGDMRLVSIVNAVRPNDKAFHDVLRSGVTSVLLAPQTRGFISGNAALIKLTGDSTKEMVVKEYAAVKFSMLGERARMDRIWDARDQLKRANEYAEKWDDYEQKYEEYERRRQYEQDKDPNERQEIKEPARPGRDTSLELLRGLFKRKMPALVHANRADEIRTTLKVFKDEYNLDVIILGGDDGFRVTDELRKYNVGVAVGPDIIRYEKGKPINNADLLAQNKLYVAFHTSATSGTQYLPMNAAYAVRHGMDEEEAFKAITIYPAKLLHVDDRIGSIEQGKDADLVILSGGPFDFRSRVEKVIVNGKIVYGNK